MTNAREEEKNDVDAVFVCFFVSARVVRLFVPLTFGLRYFVDYSLPSPHLGNVGTRHAESVSALVIGHGMPCPYHSIVSLENSSLIRTLGLLRRYFRSE